jgi:hypothetical protein
VGVEAQTKIRIVHHARNGSKQAKTTQWNLGFGAGPFHSFGMSMEWQDGSFPSRKMGWHGHARRGPWPRGLRGEDSSSAAKGLL